MSKIIFDNTDKIIKVPVALTTGKNKMRVKKRKYTNEYGVIYPTKQEEFTLNSYVEWQIGYDVVVSDTEKLSKTTLPKLRFVGSNGKEKALYELSEYIYYFYKWDIVSEKDLIDIKTFLKSINSNSLIDVNTELQIERSHPVDKKINDILFNYTQVKYPLLFRELYGLTIITEIKVTERQYASGVQPMLYICIPVSELSSSKNLIGRTAEMNETAEFIISKKNIKAFLELFKIFGILSTDHNNDVVSMIDLILKS